MSYRRGTVLHAVIGGGLLILPLTAMAQAPSPLAPDPASVWTIQDENASISSANLTDRYYTNGFKLGWVSGTDRVPGALETMGRALWGDGQMRISFDLTQQIYTAKDTASGNPPRGDRPFAGVLLGNFGLWSDTATTRSTVGFSLGMLGPAALGEQVQNGFHDLIGQGHVHGWGTQLHNEPMFEFYSERTWRLNLGNIGALETQALPDLTVGLGVLRVYAQPGFVIRIGQGLDADFGPARLRPGLSGGDVFQNNHPVSWYVFAGGDGRAVAHDVTVEGNTWEASRGAKREPLVGEFEFGVGVIVWGARLTYTQVFQSAEIRHQKGGLHQFGSLALSVRF
jgi:lipid A 3-O-deacylase